MTQCTELRIELGAYALGIAEPEETARVEAHLAGCRACRQTLARLDTLPPLLDLVDPTDPSSIAEESHPSPALEERVLAGFAAGRRRPRAWSRVPSGRRVAVVALVAVVAVALALAAVLSGGPEDEGVRVALTAPAGAPRGATGEARLRATPAGTVVALDAKLAPLESGEVYELWFGRGEGVVSAGTFRVSREGTVAVRLTTAARLGDYERMGITREPDASDPARNGTVVIAGPLHG